MLNLIINFLFIIKVQQEDYVLICSVSRTRVQMYNSEDVSRGQGLVDRGIILRPRHYAS